MNARSFRAGLPPALLVALLAGAGCLPSVGPAPAPATAAPAAAASGVRLRRGPIDRTVRLPAQVQPYLQAALCAKVGGYLRSIAVDKGDAVKAGQSLAEIEAPELIAERTQFKAEAAVAQREFDRLVAAQAKAPDLVVPQAVDEARGRLEIAQARLDRTETLLAYTRITAPFAGVVSRRFADPGAYIPAANGAPASASAIVTLVDASRVRVQTAVPEAEAPRVAVGARGRITVEELPGRVFEGTVTRLEGALDPTTRTLLAEFEMVNDEGVLRPGSFATVELVVERRPAALLAPFAAVGRDKSGSFVFVDAEGKAKRAPVVTGFRNTNDVEIVSGAGESAVVLIPAAGSLVDGQSVTLSETR